MSIEQQQIEALNRIAYSLNDVYKVLDAIRWQLVKQREDSRRRERGLNPLQPDA